MRRSSKTEDLEEEVKVSQMVRLWKEGSFNFQNGGHDITCHRAIECGICFEECVLCYKFNRLAILSLTKNIILLQAAAPPPSYKSDRANVSLSHHPQAAAPPPSCIPSKPRFPFSYKPPHSTSPSKDIP
jgi:hypothetical protein